MLKKVLLYTDLEDSQCNEVRTFLESQEIDLRVIDLRDKPLNCIQVAELIRHFNLKHFLNTDSQAFRKNKLDKNLPPRPEVFELMAGDNDLIRKPIIVSGRLMTVGCNRLKIMEMLQIKQNGSDPDAGAVSNHGKDHSIGK